VILTVFETLIAMVLYLPAKTRLSHRCVARGARLHPYCMLIQNIVGDP
jgi:hypothetical protein